MPVPRGNLALVEQWRQDLVTLLLLLAPVHPRPTVHLCCDAQKTANMRVDQKSLELRQGAQANPCLLDPRVLCVRGRTGEGMGSDLLCRL